MTTIFGANLILHHGGRLLLQRKTPGYFVRRYVGCLCLVGGGWTEATDVSPRDTATRELAEELRPRQLIRKAEEDAVAVGTFDLEIPGHVTGHDAIRLRTFCFELQLPSLDGARLLEGEAALIDDAAAFAEPVAWGHDHILRHWSKAGGLPLPQMPVEEAITCTLVDTGEPPPYAQMELEGLEVNPLG